MGFCTMEFKVEDMTEEQLEELDEADLDAAEAGSEGVAEDALADTEEEAS